MRRDADPEDCADYLVWVMLGIKPAVKDLGIKNIATEVAVSVAMRSLMICLVSNV